MIQNFFNKRNIIIFALVVVFALSLSGILLAAKNGNGGEFKFASLLSAIKQIASKGSELKEKEINNLKNIVSSKEQQLQDSRQEMEALKVDLSLKNSEFEVKDAEIANLKSQISLKEKELTGKIDEVDKLKSRISKKENENNSIKNNLSALGEERSKEVSSWQEKVSEKEKEVSEKEKEVSEKEKESSDKGQEIENLKNKMTVKSVKNVNNPILKADLDSSKWDSQNHVAGNCVIKSPENTTYLFYYASYKDNVSGISSTSVGVALSGDNINFKKHPNPVLTPGKKDEWDGGGVSVFPGCIIQRKDGTYYMYYSGVKFKEEGSDFYWNSLGGIGLAFSKDLITWEKYSKNPILKNSTDISWESEGIFEPSVIFTGDEFGGPDAFLMWYGGNNKDGVMSIGLATSFNGVDWVKHPNNPVLSKSSNSYDFDGYTVEVHHVLKNNNGYIMAYEATDRKFPSPFSVGLAFSKDGINWEKSEDNPILEGGAAGSWDSFGAYHPSILIENDKILMFYVGLVYNYDHSIGVAEINPYYFSKLQQ